MPHAFSAAWADEAERTAARQASGQAVAEADFPVMTITFRPTGSARWRRHGRFDHRDRITGRDPTASAGPGHRWTGITMALATARGQSAARRACPGPNGRS